MGGLPERMKLKLVEPLRELFKDEVRRLGLSLGLPEDIVWRRKYGMSVPATDWVLGPLRPIVDELLSDRAVRARGLFRPEFIAQLLSGTGLPSETRRRRVGEKLWALAMLEAWMRRFVDRRGATL